MKPTAIGPHLLMAGDLMEPGDVEAVLMGRPVDLLYCDPPWGPGKLKFFSGLQPGARRHDWRQFLSTLAGIAEKWVEGPVFIEMGRQWVEDVHTAFSVAGVFECGRWETEYSGGGLMRPQVIWMGAKQPSLYQVHDTLPPDGEVEWLLKTYGPPGGTVFDPCIGFGATAKAALKAGMVVRGLELNPARLARCQKVLEGHAPKASR